MPHKARAETLTAIRLRRRVKVEVIAVSLSVLLEGTGGIAG
jgi:hypothetical protein